MAENLQFESQNTVFYYILRINAYIKKKKKKRYLINIEN